MASRSTPPRKGASSRGASTRDAATEPSKGEFSTGETASPGAGPRPPNLDALSAAASAAGLDASRLMSAGPDIVLKAISVLEEEVVASGLGAAKRIEQRFLNVDELRAKHPDAVVSRFRRDAHEAVDIILDLVTAAAVLVGERAGKVVNVTASRTAPSAAAPTQASSGVPVIRAPASAAPGTTTEITMALENESDTGTAEFTLHVSELVTATGARIAAASVEFEPATLTVGPRAVGMVTIRVSIPENAPPGSYEGIVRASQMEQLRALLLVQVA